MKCLRHATMPVVAAAILHCLGTGCATTPKGLQAIGAEPLAECSGRLDLGDGTQSVLLGSVESDTMMDAWYLLMEGDLGPKAFVKLSPRKFGNPFDPVMGNHRFKARSVCYLAPPGKYRITKLIGVLTVRGPGSSTESSFPYDHSRDLDVPPGMVVYLGRYVVLDPRTKDKGYFGRMGAMLGGMLTGSLVPSEIAIEVTNGIDEDVAWLREEHGSVEPQRVTTSLR